MSLKSANLMYSVTVQFTKFLKYDLASESTIKWFDLWLLLFTYNDIHLKNFSAFNWMLRST